MWKISPRLKMSQTGSYFVLMSLMLMTSGATQPGVPQRTKRYSCSLANSASPKSATTHSQLPSRRKIRFSGLRSRCMIFFECISRRPRRIELTTSRVSWSLNLYLALTLSQRRPPSSSSTTMQRELSDSKTSKRRMQLGWLSARMTSISLTRHSLPFSSLQAASFEKAFTAQLRPSSNLSARQTDAKLPFPIFFLGLNCSWKPRWFTLALRTSRQARRSDSDFNLQAWRSSPFSKDSSGGENWKLNLMSKSRWTQSLPRGPVSVRALSLRDRVTSPSLTRRAVQVNSSCPGLTGATVEKNGRQGYIE